MKKIKSILLCIFCVIAAAMIAIAVHAFLPSPGATVDVASFDSILVKKFSFPIVASAYFVILYLHILIVIRYFGSRTVINNKEMGLRFSLAFALIYLVGMQEVVVSASPIHEYGVDYVLYQLFMGLGDAIPVIILCVIVSRFTLKTIKTEKLDRKPCVKEKVLVVSVITALFFIERVIGYVIGYLDSDIEEYPIPVIIWTLVFGITLGCAYLLIRPIYNSEKGGIITVQIVIFSLGINWIWFNSFMGLILKDTIGQMLLRSGIDVIIMGAGVWITSALIFKIRKVRKN